MDTDSLLTENDQLLTLCYTCMIAFYLYITTLFFRTILKEYVDLMTLYFKYVSMPFLKIRTVLYITTITSQPRDLTLIK